MTGRKPSWTSSFKSHVVIFSVGRGLSIFIRTALNQGIIYDFGSSEEFQPSKFLKMHVLPHLDVYDKCRIAQRFISHPHADHISDIACLTEPTEKESVFYASLHTCPHDKNEGSAKPEAMDWKRIKNPQGSENNVEIYRSLYEKRKLPLQTILFDSIRTIPNLEYGFYYVRPPIVGEIFTDNDQEYGNGVSIVFYFRHGYNTILIPGDINPDTMRHILNEGKGLEKRYTIFDRKSMQDKPTWHKETGNQPSLKTLLGSRGLSVLLAPHHGLESGFSGDLYQAMRGGKPGLVVISEKRHRTDSDGSIHHKYQKADGAFGQNVIIEGKAEKRYSVSTQDGYNILIQFEGTSGQNPEVYLEKDPEKLITRMK